MADKKPEAPTNAKQQDIVKLNAQWTECLKREARGRVLKEHFDFNPKNLGAITEKPTNKDRLKIYEKNEETQESKALTQKLAVLTNVPKKKYPYPVTSQQEIGWDTELMEIHRPKYSFNRKMEAETKYVNNYYQSMGVSPLI